MIISLFKMVSKYQTDGFSTQIDESGNVKFLKKGEKKELQKAYMTKVLQAGSSEYVTEWDAEGKIGKQKEKKKIKSGRKSRARGARFELRVRKDLVEKNWIIDKWSNNVDLEIGELCPAKRKFNPFSKVMTIGTGFPDFLCFQLIDEGKYNVIGVECKVNGILSKIEKEKCVWLLKNKVFNDIWVAKKTKDGRCIKVKYINFKEKWGKLL